MKAFTRWRQGLATALLLGAMSLPAAANPVLSLTATPDPAQAGAVLNLDVWISGISDLYAYQFSLSFDPALLQATGMMEGVFLAGGGTTFAVPGSIDNSLGTISLVANTLTGAGPGVSGSGVLAHLSFNAVHAGSTALSFADVIFLDSNGNDITLQIDNRSLLVTAAVPEPASYLLLVAGLLGLPAWRRISGR